MPVSRVTANSIADGTVVESEISDNAITSAKVSGLVNFDKVVSQAIVEKLRENVTVTASAVGANLNFDIKTDSFKLFTGTQDANFCVNVRGDGSTTLNNSMADGESITISVAITNGSTAYFLSNTQIDGSLFVPKVQGGSQLSQGNANSTDVYLLTIIKTGSGTFTTLLSQTQFA